MSHYIENCKTKKKKLKDIESKYRTLESVVRDRCFKNLKNNNHVYTKLAIEDIGGRGGKPVIYLNSNNMQFNKRTMVFY